MLIWHEIVNDVVGGVPVGITFCPSCNTGIVLDRRLGGGVLEFGTTGKLRQYDLMMYDRTTESWWQHFLGEADHGRAHRRAPRAGGQRIVADIRIAAVVARRAAGDLARPSGARFTNHLE